MNLLIEILVEVVTFAAVVAATFGALRALDGFITVRRRLGGTAAVSGSPGNSLIKQEKVSHPILTWVESSSSLSDSKDREKLRRDLALVGLDSPAGPVWYIILRFGLA